jgi:hypothetical protein
MLSYCIELGTRRLLRHTLGVQIWMPGGRKRRAELFMGAGALSMRDPVAKSQKRERIVVKLGF